MKGLFAAVSVVALLAGVPAWAQAPASSQALNDQDRMFLKQAGDGNLAEVKLGQLAMQKAANPAIQEFGRWMATDHGFANVRLAAIAKRIGVAGFQPKLNSQDQQMQRKLQGLSGAQFDRQYTQMMVRDHKSRTGRTSCSRPMRIICCRSSTSIRRKPSSSPASAGSRRARPPRRHARPTSAGR
jgi:predicted outer membrane protein